MQEIKFLTSREKKRLGQEIQEQWDAPLPEGQYLANNKNRYYLFTGDLADEDQRRKISSLGCYFAEQSPIGLRLSIEGAQTIGAHATKNVIDVDRSMRKAWFEGEDLSFGEGTAGQDALKDCSGFVILRYDGIVLGCGRVKEGSVQNYLSKTRRLVDPLDG